MSVIKFNVTRSNTIVSEVYIYKNEYGMYSYETKGNFMLCPDCRSIFSVHARACPFCGCPMDYIIPYWYENFYSINTQNQMIEEERNRKLESERLEKLGKEKTNLINEINRLNSHMSEEEKVFVDTDDDIEYIKGQLENLKKIKSDKETTIRWIEGYKDSIDLKELPSFSMEKSLTQLKSIYEETVGNFNKLEKYKSEIRDWMNFRRLSYSDLGGDLKRYDSKSIKDKEILIRTLMYWKM